MTNTVSIKRAALITGISKYVNVFLGIIFSAILSRILSPNDYGIVAIITVFTTFFSVLSNFGLSAAIIQNKDFSQHDIDSLFSYSIILAIILTISFIILSFPISIFYKNRIYIPIGILLSISVFFNTLNMVPDGLLRKEKKFLLIGIRLIVVSIFTYSLTIILAILNFKYYALVLQSIISSLFIFLWNLKNIRVNITLHPNKDVIRRIKTYSGFEFLDNFSNYFARNLDKLIIGKVIGNEDLAQYNKAYHFMLYPVQNLTNIVSPVLHPILSDYQDNKEIIYNKYIRVLKILSLVGIFITPICYSCSKEIIGIIYGAQWNQAVYCLKYLSFAIWTQMLVSSTGGVFNALGSTRNKFFSTTANTFINIIFLIIGTRSKDIIIISKFISIAYCFTFINSFFMLIKLTMKISFMRFLINFIPDLFIAALLFFITIIENKYIASENIFISFILKSVILFIAYVLFLFLFRQMKYFKMLIKRSHD